MRLALLGNGKTGAHVQSLNQKHELTVFNRSNPITLEGLKDHDVAISFLPGDVFNQQIELLVGSGISVVSGSTGDVDLTALDKLLKKKNRSWVHGNNFSIAMTAVRAALGALGSLQKIGDFQFSMEEIHHQLKMDAPSGTAKSWKQWLGVKDLEIKSLRQGDIVGVHSVSILSKFEKIELRHEAYDRRLFAEGALWAAERVFEGRELPSGLTSFQDLIAQALDLKGDK
ncbi:hypothetical protein GW915_07350 [bacterium]|nr:hypothetical protein [bacterium]